MKKIILITLIVLFGSVLYSQPNPYSVTKWVKTTQDTIILSRYRFDVKLTVESFGNSNDTIFIKTQRVDTNFNSEYFICKNNFSVNYIGTKFILKSNIDSVKIKYYIGECDIKKLNSARDTSNVTVTNDLTIKNSSFIVSSLPAITKEFSGGDTLRDAVDTLSRILDPSSHGETTFTNIFEDGGFGESYYLALWCDGEVEISEDVTFPQGHVKTIQAGTWRSSDVKFYNIGNFPNWFIRRKGNSGIVQYNFTVGGN